MYSEEMKDFLLKVFDKSGLSPTGTYLPSNIHPDHIKAGRVGAMHAGGVTGQYHAGVGASALGFDRA